MGSRVLVVGAGFAGSVCAERLAKSGHEVLVIDRRSHVGGNAFDEFDANGVLIHRYGPHIFHTNSKRVFEYLSRFTDWRFYEHRVLADLGNKRVPFPINRTTLNRLYDLQLDEAGAVSFLEGVAERRESAKTSEDVVLGSVGRDLCETFFRGYSKKQWGLDLSELSAGVAARIPTRTNTDDRYFTDTFQFMPSRGYAVMFENMLDHPLIRVELNTDYFEFDRTRFDIVVYTGPIDLYFGRCYGELPYRSLRFEHEYVSGNDWVQPVGTVNFPNHQQYTRITEFKHLTGQAVKGTSIVREYPQAEGDPYYPIPQPRNEVLFKQYEELASKEKGTVFVGRLAQYRYYNMDQVVGAALTASEKVAGDG